MSLGFSFNILHLFILCECALVVVFIVVIHVFLCVQILWQDKTLCYGTVHNPTVCTSCLKEWKKSNCLSHEKKKNLAWNKKHTINKSASFGMDLSEPFPDEAINCEMPHVGGSVVLLLREGEWETEWLSGSITISASSSNCMIGIFGCCLGAPNVASFIVWLKSLCASQSIYLWLCPNHEKRNKLKLWKNKLGDVNVTQ